MLRSIKELFDYKMVSSTGEDVGSVRDFHYDSVQWIVRYLEVDVGKWLAGRRILLPPTSVNSPEWSERRLRIGLTREQIQGSPHFTPADRLDRSHETQLYTYYGWQPYWAGGIMTEPSRTAIAAALGEGRRTAEPDAESPLTTGSKSEGHVRWSGQDELNDPNRPRSGPSRGLGHSSSEPEDAASQPEDEANLRLMRETIGSYVHAIDGEIGHVDDFIVDDTEWLLRYAVVDTRNWLPGKKVLLATWWINQVDWQNDRVHMDLKRDTIKNSPEFDPSTPVNREYEDIFFDYYGRPKYWQ